MVCYFRQHGWAHARPEFRRFRELLRPLVRLPSRFSLIAQATRPPNNSLTVNTPRWATVTAGSLLAGRLALAIAKSCR